MLRSKSVMVVSFPGSIDLHLFRQPIAAQNNEKKSSQLHGFACSSCNSSPAVFSKAFLVLFSSSSLLRHQRRLSSSAMTCSAKILSLCEKYQVVAISKGPLTVCWEERLRHASWTCSMSTLLLVCSLAPALESHYCCGARRRWRHSRLILSHRFALFLWLSDNKGSQERVECY